MKKVIFVFVLVFTVICGFAQNPMQNHMPNRMAPSHMGPNRFNFRYVNPKIDLSKFVIVDSLLIERIQIYSPFDYDDETVIDLGENTYIIELPHKDHMIIKYNEDRTKAIVVYNSIVFGRHEEFNVKDDNPRRIIFWYQDEDLFCGYVYDKYYKVAKYFELREKGLDFRKIFPRF